MKSGRAVGACPAASERGGVRYIAPVDSDCGGTWIAANEFGVSVCLLNRGNGHGPLAAESRGLLVDELGGGCLPAWNASCG